MRLLPVCAALGWLLLSAPAHAGESCNDGKKNGPESDVDCGGDCPSCAVGQSCASARDCASGLCGEGVCQERVIARGTDAPPGYETRASSSDAGATARHAGLLFFGVGYAGAYVSALALPGKLSWMYAPVFGPWLSLRNVEEPVLKALIVADGALQAGGAALIIGGVVSSGSQIVRTEQSARIVVTPSVHRHGASVDLFGSF